MPFRPTWALVALLLVTCAHNELMSAVFGAHGPHPTTPRELDVNALLQHAAEQAAQLTQSVAQASYKPPHDAALPPRWFQQRQHAWQSAQHGIQTLAAMLLQHPSRNTAARSATRPHVDAHLNTDGAGGTAAGADNAWQPWATFLDDSEDAWFPTDAEQYGDRPLDTVPPTSRPLTAMRRPDANDLPSAEEQHGVLPRQPQPWPTRDASKPAPLDPKVTLDERDVVVLGDADDVALRFRDRQHQPTVGARQVAGEGPLLDVPLGDPLLQWRGPVQQQQQHVQLWDLDIGREGSRVVVNILLEGDWEQASSAVLRLEQARSLQPTTSPLLSVSLSHVQRTGYPPRAFTKASLRVEDGADVAVHLQRGPAWGDTSARGVVVSVTSVALASRALLMRCHLLMLTGALLIAAAALGLLCLSMHDLLPGSTPHSGDAEDAEEVSMRGWRVGMDSGLLWVPWWRGSEEQRQLQEPLLRPCEGPKC